MAGRKLSGAVILTGGHDCMGRPLITFVPSHQTLLVRTEDVMTEVAHVLRLAPTSPMGAAFLANFRAYNREHMLAVVDVLEKLQLQNRGTVGVLYAVLPKSRDLQKTLKKQLGLKASRKAPKVQSYQCILVHDVKELHKTLDASQLTGDFEGTMPYDHTAWTKFTQQHEELLRKIEDVSRRVPSGLDKLGMMLEYDIPTDPAEAEKLLTSVRQKYNNVMREINLEHTIDACKEYTENLKSPANNMQALPQNMLLTALQAVEVKMEGLIRQRQELKQIWQQAETRIVMKTKVQKYKAKAEKILQWIKDIGMPGVNEDPDIADCLSKAEILKTHFETGFYANAKNVVWLSRKIQKKLEDLVLENKKNIPDLLKFSRNFQATTEYFKKAVDKKYQVYVNVHSFYLTSQKGVESPTMDDVTLDSGVSIYSCVDQMTNWYQRTLNFIPVQLLCERTMYDGRGREVKVIQPTNAWRAAVDDFIHRHPMPKVSQLSKLDKVLPVIDNLIVRNQARLLIHRIKIICKLLASIDGTPTGVVGEVLRWRNQVESGADDITLNKHTTDAVDPSSLPQFESNFPTVSLGSISRLSHASSTKSLSGQKFVLKEIAYDDDTDGTYYSLGRRARSPAKKTAHFQDQTILRNKSDATVRIAPRERSLPRAATLDRSSKLRSQSEHNLNYIPDNTSHHMPPKVTRFEKKRPVVPPLDLSFVGAKKKSASKSKTPQVDDDFGIYGDSDDSEIPMPKERYISLEIPDSSQMAQTLKHVSIRTPDEMHRIQRPDSVTDSGITHTQTGTDASALSLNTLGLSPVGIDTPATAQATPAQKPAQSTSNPALFSKSLPDLNYQPNGNLDLTQTNIDAICKSPLSEEEKMNLMAALCEDLDSSSRPPSRTQAMLHRLSNNTTPAETTQLKPDVKPLQSKSPVSDLRVSRNHTSVQGTEASSSQSRKQASRPHSTVPNQNEEPNSNEVPLAASQTDSGPPSVSSPDDQKKKKQEYGIDVAAWVNRYGYDADSLEAESTGIGSVEVNSNDGIEEYVEKLKAHHFERKEDELEWQKERRRTKDIQLEEEALCQDNVEQSLKRTQRLLQEQERLMQGSPANKQFAPRTSHEREIPRGDVGVGGENFDDCSASEESGVFTQTSNDSRFRFSESGSELHLRMMLPNDVNRSKPKQSAPAMPENITHQVDTKPASRASFEERHKFEAKTPSQQHYKPSVKTETQPDVRPKSNSASYQMDYNTSHKTDTIALHMDTKLKGTPSGRVAASSTKRQAPKPAPRLSRVQKPQTVQHESELNIKDNRVGDTKPIASDHNGKCMTDMLDNNAALDATASSSGEGFGGGTLCSEDGSIKVTGLDSESELINEDEQCSKSQDHSKKMENFADETPPVAPITQYRSTDALNIIGRDNMSTRSFTEDEYTDETNSIDCELSIPDNALRQLERQQSRTPEKRITIHHVANKKSEREQTRTPEIEFLSEGEMNYESDESDYTVDAQKNLSQQVVDKSSYSDMLQAINKLKGGDERLNDVSANCSQGPLKHPKDVHLKGNSKSKSVSEQDHSMDKTSKMSPEMNSSDCGYNEIARSQFEKTNGVGNKPGNKEGQKERVLEDGISEASVKSAGHQDCRHSESLQTDHDKSSQKLSKYALESSLEDRESVVNGDPCIDVSKYQLKNHKGTEEGLGNADDVHLPSSTKSQNQVKNMEKNDTNHHSMFITKLEHSSPEISNGMDLKGTDSNTRSLQRSKVESMHEMNKTNPEQYQERAVDVPSVPIPHSDKHKRFSSPVNMPPTSETKKVKKEKKGIFSFFKRKTKKKDKSDSLASEESSLQSFETSSIASATLMPTPNNKQSRNTDLRDRQMYSAVPYECNTNSNTENVKMKNPPRQPPQQNPAVNRPEPKHTEKSKTKKAAPLPPQENSALDSVSSTNAESRHYQEKNKHHEDRCNKITEQSRHQPSSEISDAEQRSRQHSGAKESLRDVHDGKQQVKSTAFKEKTGDDGNKSMEKIGLQHQNDSEYGNGIKRINKSETDEEQTVEDDLCSEDDRHSLEDVESLESDSVHEEMVLDGDESCKAGHTTFTTSYPDFGSEIPISRCYTTEMLNLKTPVIIDNGSGMCKCGLASSDTPTAVFPNVIGRPKYKEVVSGEYKDVYVGQEAQRYRGMLQMTYPIEHGLVNNWHDMELLWEHAFHNELRVDPSEHPVLLTEPPLNPLKHRERMAEVMFETFSTPAFYVSIQAVLALYGSGRTTGVVLDIGDGVTHVVPVYEGYSLPHATYRVNLAGRDLTHYLISLLKEGGVSLTTSAETEIARDIKEQHCYVAESFYEESLKATMGSNLEELYYMPDGNPVALNSERFRCPEVLFQPSFIGMEDGGIHQNVQQAINKCDIDIRKSLLQNVILSGGTTMLPGLPERMESELLQLFPSVSASGVNVKCADDRQYLVWKGGAALASMPNFTSSWFFRQEYEEFGTNLVHKKCF